MKLWKGGGGVNGAEALRGLSSDWPVQWEIGVVAECLKLPSQIGLERGRKGQRLLFPLPPPSIIWYIWTSSSWCWAEWRCQARALPSPSRDGLPPGLQRPPQPCGAATAAEHPLSHTGTPPSASGTPSGSSSGPVPLGPASLAWPWPCVCPPLL